MKNQYTFIGNLPFAKQWRPFYFLLIGLLPFTSIAQTGFFEGTVIAWDEPMKMDMPVAGASVYWMNSSTGVSTDADGKFKLALPKQLPAKAIVSFIGLKADTILIEHALIREIRLAQSAILKEVDVKAKRDAVGISTLKPMNTEVITQKEILKAACCNLSEAFETSPTVNVAYKDAVTGAKEIQLLGLAGIYAQLMTENIPNYRGIAGIYGLSFIPGPWMESIQVTKGSGSVVNGYESTTGQINVEFKKPQDIETPRFYLNLFGESNGNTEINTFLKKKYNEKWSTVLMLHGNYMQTKIDRNHDGFMDVPMSKQLNIYDRWQFHSGRNVESQFGFKLLHDDREGGQTADHNYGFDMPSKYRVNVRTNRAEVFGKLGFVYPEKPFRSIGNIAQFTWHDMKSSFGTKNYDATQNTLYLQSIYQNIIVHANHQYKAGLTYRYDQLNEQFLWKKTLSTQSVPGAFFEYTYSYLDRLTLVSGVREDWVEKNTWLFTPRFHGKYNFSSDFLVRVSAGSSYRTPYLFADNISMLASSKQLDIPASIEAERAWNYGFNLTWKFHLGGKEASMVGDFYRTDFTNQLVMDAYSDSSRITFYNLHGNSFAHSVQLTLNYELIERLELRIAWKLDDVKTEYSGTLQQKPLVAKNKAMLNLSYATANDHWKFDYTVTWEGRKKLENTFEDVENMNPTEFSPAFSVMSFQVTKVFRKFEAYAGIGNALDYRQKHPIINPENPFSNSFDASNVWGPVEGRRIYAGLRFSIK